MKQRNRRQRRALHLTLALILLAALGFFGWVAEGCPVFTLKAAFRGALQNAALPTAKLDGILGDNSGSESRVALSHWDDGAVAVRLTRRNHAWRGGNASWFAAADGVPYVMLDKIPYSSDNSYGDTNTYDYKNRAVAAVWTEGRRAELRLVLEDVTFDEIDSYWAAQHSGAVGGTWPLRVLETQGDWTVFAFDFDSFPDGFKWIPGEYIWCPTVRNYPYEGYEACWDAFCWLQNFLNRDPVRNDYPDRLDVQPARFELTLYDEAGAVAKTVAWDPCEALRP